MVTRLEGLTRSFHIHRRLGSSGPGLQLRSHLDNIASLGTPEEIGTQAKDAAKLWLRSVLLERVVDALVLRGAEAAFGETDGYLEWTTELLAACDGVGEYAAPAAEGASTLETAAREALALLGG